MVQTVVVVGLAKNGEEYQTVAELVLALEPVGSSALEPGPGPGLGPGLGLRAVAVAELAVALDPVE